MTNMNIDMRTIHWNEIDQNNDWQLCDQSISPSWNAVKYPGLKLPYFLYENGGIFYAKEQEMVTCEKCQKLIIGSLPDEKLSYRLFFECSWSARGLIFHRMEGQVEFFDTPKRENENFYDIITYRRQKDGKLKRIREFLGGKDASDLEYWLGILLTEDGKFIDGIYSDFITKSGITVKHYADSH